MLKRIALHGSYYGYNFGDTLLCALFAGWIRSVASGAEITLPLASERNRKLIGGDRRGLLAFLRCSDVVFCGGGYFGEPAHGKLYWSFRNYFRHFLVADLSLLMRKRIIILGTGVGPVSSRFLRWRLKRLVERADVVAVRDEESRRFLREELAVERDIEIHADAATHLEASYFHEAKVSLPLAEEDARKKVLIHLTNYGADVWPQLASVLEKFFASRPDLLPVLITDSASRSGRQLPQDQACIRLKEGIPSAVHVRYEGEPAALCKLISNVDLIVTNKLHVGIVGVTLGRTVIALPQHAKTQRFYRQLNASEVCVTEDQPAGLERLLEKWEAGLLHPVRLSSSQNPYRVALAGQLGH